MPAHATNYGPADLLLLGAAMILALAFGLVGMAILNGKHSTRCPICGSNNDHQRADRCKGACAPRTTPWPS